MCMKNFSEVLKEHGKFCCWRYEERNGRWTKVPYQPGTGIRTKSNDPNTFSLFDTAIQTEKNFDGIGIGIFGDICAIDLDHCVTEDGHISNEASEIIELMHSYTEYSPSKKGIHILFAAKGFVYDKTRYYIMNHKREIEVYVAGATNKFVTVTGDRANAYEYGGRSQELRTLLDRYMQRPQKPLQKDRSNSYAGNAINAGNTADQLTESEIIRRALSSQTGAKFQKLYSGDISDYPSHSEADMALCAMLAFGTGNDPSKMDAIMRTSGLMRDKWDRPQSGTTYGAITIQKAVESCSDPLPKKESVSSNTIQAAPLFHPVKPIRPETNELPTFPTECLPAILGDYVKSVAEHSQTAPDMAAVIGLGILASCLQHKFQVEGNPGYTEPLNLYVVVIAPPGERKSSVLRDMTKPIYEYELEYNAKIAPEIKENEQTREILKREISDLQKKIKQHAKNDSESQELMTKLQDAQTKLNAIPELTPIRLQADDCTSEALTVLLSTNGECITVISAEGGIFDILNGRYSDSVNIDVWLKAHCGDTIQVDRIGRESEYITNPALTAILAIQPSVLGDIMANRTMAGRGLLARFLYSVPESRIGTRKFSSPAIPDEIASAYYDFLFKLMKLPRKDTPEKITLSEPAREIMNVFFEKHEHYLVGEGQEIADWANKYIGTILRIAGLLHLTEEVDSEKHEISAKTMKNAIKIGKYFLAHARYAYAIMGTDINVKKALFVEAKIRNLHEMGIKRSELYQKCRGKFFHLYG